MSLNGDIKGWRRPPEEVAAYLAGDGELNLGEPDYIESPKPLNFMFNHPLAVVQDDEYHRNLARESAKRSHESRKTLLNKERYEQEKAAGMIDKEIAEKYGILLRTLQGYASKWRKQAQ